MKNRRNIFKVFISVSGLIVLDKILGFIKQMIVASSFGATNETDIINLSQSAVTDIQYILAQAMITSFVSIYIYFQSGEKGSKEKSKVFAGSAIFSFAVISLLITVALMLTAPIVSKVLAPSYSELMHIELTFHIRIYSTLIILFSLICIFRAILSANKRFIPEQLISFNQSVITIVLVFIIGNKYGPSTLVISFFCFTIWNAIYLGFLCRKDIKLTNRSIIENVEVKQLFRMMGPLLLGYSLIYINQMVDRMLVSGLGTGVITSLTYGATLSNLITAFITAFCSMIFSYITSEISKKEYMVASNIANTATQVLIIIFMPITITFVICSHDIVSVVYGRGAFDDSAVQSASMALKGYAIMFVPVVIREIYSRFQYAFQDSKKPMINGSIGIVGNIVLSILFCRIWRVFGVALATSLSVLITGLLNMISARRKTNELNYSFLKNFSIKMASVTGLCIITSLGIYQIIISTKPIFRVMTVFAESICLFALVFGKYFFKQFKQINTVRRIDIIDSK